MKGKFGIFLAGGFLVLATVAAATGNFAVRFNAAAQQALNSQPSGTINVQRITLAEGAATGFGQFRQRANNVIAPGTQFNIYLEPTNVTTRFDNGNVRAMMSVD